MTSGMHAAFQVNPDHQAELTHGDLLGGKDSSRNDTARFEHQGCQHGSPSIQSPTVALLPALRGRYESVEHLRGGVG
jgi:hypothetical protein